MASWRLHGPRRRALIAALIAAGMLVAGGVELVTAATPGLGKGSFLVARRGLFDPNFSRTVVLLLEYGADGAVGLVVNRPTDIAVSSVLPDIEGLADSPERLFSGGPVSRQTIMLLVRAERRPGEAEQVTGEIWVSASRDLLEEVAGDGRTAERTFRVYSGYAGWGAGQLDREIESGGWLVLPADEEAVFAPDPRRVWERMIERGSTSWAGWSAESQRPASFGRARRAHGTSLAASFPGPTTGCRLGWAD